jgi:NADPH:quinone reductase-like Zn-dependent oxidoreductase
MKAFVIDRYGRKNGIRVGDMPMPEPREDDVLIQIHAAGVNPLDSKIRDGEFKLILPYRLPLILGNDLAGVVVRVGSRARRFKPGDEVYARPHKDQSKRMPWPSSPQRSRWRKRLQSRSWD